MRIHTIVPGNIKNMISDNKKRVWSVAEFIIIEFLLQNRNI